MPIEHRILAVSKESTGEKYVFLYRDDEESRGKLFTMFGRYAADPELSFTWSDAALLSQRVRALSK